MQHDPAETTSHTASAFDVCSACGRSQPFTEAIKAGLPLGQICTCAIEHRAIERLTRQIKWSSLQMKGAQ